MSPKTPNGLLHGTLDALILKTLAGGPRHGYAIAKFIEDTTDETVLGPFIRRSIAWNTGAGWRLNGVRLNWAVAPRSIG